MAVVDSNKPNVKGYTVDLNDDPIWEIGDVHLLAIFRTGSVLPSPQKYVVVGRKRMNDKVRYELREW